MFDCLWLFLKQALGRSRGGFSSKIHFAISGNGLPLSFTLTPGQSAEIHELLPLLRRRKPKIVIADTAYNSNKSRQLLDGWETQIVIPGRPNRKIKPDYDKLLYKKRYAVECFISKVKHFRRLATRYDKTKTAYAAMVALACIRIYFRFCKQKLVVLNLERIMYENNKY